MVGAERLLPLCANIHAELSVTILYTIPPPHCQRVHASNVSAGTVAALEAPGACRMPIQANSVLHCTCLARLDKRQPLEKSAIKLLSIAITCSDPKSATFILPSYWPTHCILALTKTPVDGPVLQDGSHRSHLGQRNSRFGFNFSVHPTVEPSSLMSAIIRQGHLASPASFSRTGMWFPSFLPPRSRCKRPVEGVKAAV